MDMSKDKQNEPDVRNDQIEDYILSRAIYAQLIETGMTGLEALVELAKESEHPRAFEILGNYLKNIGDLNDKLIDTQRKMQIINQEQAMDRHAELEGPDPRKAIAFTGSTKDISKALKDLRDSEAIDVEFTEIKDDDSTDV